MSEASIFINYRRSVSASVAGRLYDRLSKHYEQGRLFMDVDAIPPGVDFVTALHEKVARCDVFIAVIGRGWATLADDAGHPRLEDPGDYVRVEIEAALTRGIPVIPVLVEDAQMPKARDLPDSIKPLVRRQAVQLSHQRFGAEVDALAAAIDEAVGDSPRARQQQPPEHASVQDQNPRSLVEALFSFKGRLSRAMFWKAAALYFGGVFTMSVLAGIFIAAINMSDPDPTMRDALLRGDPPDFDKQMADWRVRFLITIVAVPFYWPYFAITMKRLHDLNLGRAVLVPFVLLTLVPAGFLVAGYTAGYSAQLTANLVAWVLLGLVEGTRGDNRFGPSPSR